MFKTIKNIFRKKSKPKKINKDDKRTYVSKKEHGTDISFENETKKSPVQKETKETKSSLTFGK
jgi:hypothetical protein|tara:strand:- start:417 stop:605 length:189 start_codon:yes stop_codon:yes gene_type:complete